MTVIAQDVQSVVITTSLFNLPDEVYDELADLDTNEMDRLNGMLKEYNEEG